MIKTASVPRIVRDLTYQAGHNLFSFGLSFVLVLLFHVGLGQTIPLTLPKPVPISAEAAAVQRYASYPVSRSTGVANINIPLYEIKSGDLTLPISLTYHSSGFRPRESSGWVGTGWTLQAAPSIMRSARGLPDDQLDSKLGYFYNHFSRNPGSMGSLQG